MSPEGVAWGVGAALAGLPFALFGTSLARRSLEGGSVPFLHKALLIQLAVLKLAAMALAWKILPPDDLSGRRGFALGFGSVYFAFVGMLAFRRIPESAQDEPSAPRECDRLE